MPQMDERRTTGEISVSLSAADSQLQEELKRKTQINSKKRSQIGSFH